MTKLILISSLLSISLFVCDRGTVDTNTQTAKPRDTVQQPVLTDAQKKILDGAKKCLTDKFSYDMSMAYHVLTYKDGKNTGSSVYPNGDMEPSLGVCVEVTIRALRYAGIVDLQQAVHDDIKANFDKYPMSRWGATKPDANIDHRRVPNQLVWFHRNWKEITDGPWQPGDIVVWDMDKDSWGDHIGIISDKIENGRYFVIHNFPSPGYVAEEDVIDRWKVIGHFRVN